nr:sigma-54-dependent Fis family transcriptional regulator [Planctomycetales bacterium]
PDEFAEPSAEGNEGPSEGGGTSFQNLLGKPLVDVEKQFIGETLNLVGGNREEAAKILGIGQRTLYRKIKEFQL